jgi:hypothetical protein
MYSLTVPTYSPSGMKGYRLKKKKQMPFALQDDLNQGFSQRSWKLIFLELVSKPVKKFDDLFRNSRSLAGEVLFWSDPDNKRL